MFFVFYVNVVPINLKNIFYRSPKGREKSHISARNRGSFVENNHFSCHICLFPVKPIFNKEPQDVVALSGQKVVFECSVDGDPTPNVLWRREDGKMPIGRARILDDKSLLIDNVQTSDEGLYICDAENLVGSISARASLVVNCECFGKFGRRGLNNIFIRTCS